MADILIPILMALVVGYLATVIARVTGTVYIPYLLLLGIIFGPILSLINPQEATLLFYQYIGPIGAAFIILDESSKISRIRLRRVFKPTISLITFVLFVSGILTGLFVILVARTPIWVGFVIGAIISSTDPASIIPSLKKHKIPEVPSTILVSESVFNDPFSYMFLVVVLAIFLPATISSIQVSFFHIGNLWLFLVLSQFVFPVVIAFLLFLLVRLLRISSPNEFREYYTAMILLFGLSSYVLTIIVGGSGYMSIAIFGILAGNYMPRDKEMESYQVFMDDITQFVVIFIFVFLGASIDLAFIRSYLLVGVIIALFLIFVVRPFSVLLAGSIDRQIQFSDLVFVGLEGTRGVFPAILAPTVLIVGIKETSPYLSYWGKAIEAIIIVIIFTSLTIQPLFMGKLKESLNRLQ
jgi:NhaP-type Na+/H+ or K+/H+ antiporter